MKYSADGLKFVIEYSTSASITDAKSTVSPARGLILLIVTVAVAGVVGELLVDAQDTASSTKNAARIFMTVFGHI